MLGAAPIDGAWARLVSLLHEGVALFTQAQHRTYWLSLLSAAVIVGVVWWRRGDADLRGALRRLLSRSTRVDLGFVAIRPIVAALVLTPWIATAFSVAVWTHNALSAHIDPLQLDWPPLAVAALFCVVLFVAWDLSRFVVHWAMHEVPALWQFHQVHHGAPGLNPLTLYRVHPVERVLYRIRGVFVTGLLTGLFYFAFGGKAVQLELLGVNALGLLFNLVGGNLRHSHVRWGFGRLERWFVSPAQHQIHHQRDAMPTALARNYGTFLAVWDRMLGSWAASDSVEEGPFGIAVSQRNHDPERLLSALFDPFLGVLRLWASRRRGTKVATMATLAVGLVSAGQARAAPPEDDDDEVDLDLSTLEDQDEDGEQAGEGDAAGSGDVPPPDSPDPPASEDDPGVDLEVPLDEGDADQATEANPGDPETAAEAPGPGNPFVLDDVDDVDAFAPQVSIFGDEEELPRITGSAHRVGKRELEQAEYDDVHRVLERVPGVYVRGEDGFGLRPNIGLRGVDPNRSSKVTLMEDGVLLGPAPYAAPAAYYFPQTTRLVGVEVFKGPASIRYGPNTIGGAINVQTRPIPTDMAGGFDVAAGVRGYGKFHGYWGKSWKYGGLVAEAVRVQSNGFKELDGGGNTGFGKNEAMLKARVNSKPGRRLYHQVEFKGGIASEFSNETYLGLAPDDFADTPYRRYAASQKGRMDWIRSQVQASYLMLAGDLVEFKLTGYRHDFDRSWRKFNAFRGGPNLESVLGANPGGQSEIFLAILRGDEDSASDDQTLLIGTNHRTYVSQGVQAAVAVYPETKYVDQKIELGARFHRDQVIRDHTEEGYSMVSSTLVPEGGDAVTTTLNRGVASTGAFHLYDEIRIVDRLTVSPGARVELIDTQFRNELAGDQSRAFRAVFIPGVGAHVQIVDWLGAFAGVHSGFSPVAPGQAAEVRPERSVNYEGGLRVGWEGLSAEATGYYTDYSNLTGECTFSQGCADQDVGLQFNAGRVQVAGSEVSLGYDRSFRRGAFVSVHGNYTLTWNRFDGDFTSPNPQFGEVEAGDRIPYIPLHAASGQIAGGIRRFSLNFSVRYTGEMRDVPGQGAIPDEERIPGYVVLDAGGRVFITKRTSVYLNVQNLTNNAYIVSKRPFGARPGRPIFGMLGLKFEFN